MKQIIQLTEYISGTKTVVTDGVEETVVDFKKVNNDGVITSNELALKKIKSPRNGCFNLSSRHNLFLY